MANIREFLLGSRERRKTILWIAAILAATLLLLIVADFLFYSTNKFGRLWNWVDPERYQAVFLSNGQVYFGKVLDVNSETLMLEDIYYLKTVQNLQLSAGDKTGGADGEGSPDNLDTQNFSLVKLGNEIHGPEDKMSVNLEHVLFVENLKPESKVVEAIKEYKNRK